MECPKCHNDVDVVRFAGKIVLRGGNAQTYPNPEDGGKCPHYKCGHTFSWETINEEIYNLVV